jgi:hypothetical protein
VGGDLRGNQPLGEIFRLGRISTDLAQSCTRSSRRLSRNRGRNWPR